jgi:arylformamidase
MLDTDKLATLTRGEFPEVVIRGEISVVGEKGELFATRSERGFYPARSCLKPFQFYAAGIDPAEWEGQERYAASLGSTLATEFQCTKLREWSQSRKQLVPHLKLPRALPADDAHRAELKKKAENPAQLFNNCFSKHMGILEGCEKNGWPLEGYLELSHPYNQQLQKTLEQFLGRKFTPKDWVTDGCLLPSPVLTNSELARLYQLLASGVEPKLAKLRDLMLANPNWVSGPGSLDTELMVANPGRVIAKKGADGLLALSILPSKGSPAAVGVVLKSELGLQMDRLMIALQPVLERFDLTPVHRAPTGHKIKFHYSYGKSPALRVHDITPVLRPKLGLFPEEVAFCRKVSHDTEKGDVITLSSIETTLHAGAHTDAPNHFARSAKGIDQVDVAKYFGPCQVVTLKLKPGQRATSDMLKDMPILTPRVLVRTDTYPDESKFTDQFAALSDSFIDYLGERGVKLVGIDTPSIDPAQSKSLESHTATLKWEMAILENVRLSGVADGVYTLLAVPLRIEGGDASPVRALLVSQA